jgi:hypothetical protein
MHDCIPSRFSLTEARKAEIVFLTAIDAMLTCLALLSVAAVRALSGKALIGSGKIQR